MRQLPAAYFSAVHGPVFAYITRDGVHACCVTWRDEYVVLTHDELLKLPTLGGKPDVSVSGVLEVVDLDEAVLECMAPTSIKAWPRRYTVGEAIFSGHLFNSMIYAPGEAR